VIVQQNIRQRCCQIVIGGTTASAGCCRENKMARGRKNLQLGILGALGVFRDGTAGIGLIPIVAVDLLT
jgi:hypothetical protein